MSDYVSTSVTMLQMVRQGWRSGKTMRKSLGGIPCKSFGNVNTRHWVDVEILQ